MVDFLQLRRGSHAVRTSALVAVAATALLAGCGSTLIIDEAKVQELIETDLAEQLGEPITDAACPRISEPEVGQEFECTAIIDGSTVRFAGEVVDADEGEVSVENADAVLERTELESVIVEQFEPQLEADLEVDCGDDRILVVAPNTSIRCDIADEFGDEAFVRVDVLNAQGSVEFELEFD